MLEVHYAPRTPALRCDNEEQLLGVSWPESSSVLIVGEHDPAHLPTSAISVRLSDPLAAAANLYRVFHEFDAAEREAIVVIMPPDRPEWSAVRDRLIRATRPLPSTEPQP